MKLFKFRSLGDELSLCRARGIIETGQFWCSKFWELNDPMEGVYEYEAGSLTKQDVRLVFKEKEKRVICSFSGEGGFTSPLMWGHYANGFRGIAIEIDTKHDTDKFHEVKYPTTLRGHEWNDGWVEKLLATKLNSWSYEFEHRYIANQENAGLRKIGTVTGLYLGNPYARTVNRGDAQSHRVIREYLRFRDDLRRVADDCDIQHHEVGIEEGRVIPV